MTQKDMENEKDMKTDEPQLNYRGIKAMPFVIGMKSRDRLHTIFCYSMFCFVFFSNIWWTINTGNETFEKLGTIGTSTNLLVYLTTVFNMKSITATTLINVFIGTTNFATLLGAFLCDTYFGRYKTLGFASVASLMVFLALLFTIFKFQTNHAGSQTRLINHVNLGSMAKHPFFANQ